MPKPGDFINIFDKESKKLEDKGVLFSTKTLRSSGRRVHILTSGEDYDTKYYRAKTVKKDVQKIEKSPWVGRRRKRF